MNVDTLTLDYDTDIRSTFGLNFPLGIPVAHPNGKIYCAPYGGTAICIFSSSTDTYSALGSFSSDASKWVGSALGIDSNVYFLPFTNATSIIKLNCSTDSWSYVLEDEFTYGVQHWYNAVSAANGHIIGTPQNKVILDFNPITETYITTAVPEGSAGNWRAGALAQNGSIYCPPLTEASYNIIKIYQSSPYSNNISTERTISKYYNKGG